MKVSQTKPANTEENKIFICAECGKEFKYRRSLLRHQREEADKDKTHTCVKCGTSYQRQRNLTDHLKTCTGQINKRRLTQTTEIEDPDEKRRREEAEQIAYEIANIPEEMFQEYDGPLLEDQEGEGQVVKEECTLDENATISKYQPNKQQKHDLLLTLQEKKKTIVNQLHKQLKKKRGIKWFLSSNVKMVKTKPEGDDEVATPHFRSKCNTTMHANTIEEQYDEAVEKIKTSFLEYQKEGSGWQMDEVLHLDLGVATYTPISGATYLTLPKRIKDKKAVLNIQNKDQKCFLWSVLAAIYPVSWGSHPHRVQHYLSSLERLVDNLSKEGVDKFKVLRKHVDIDKIHLLLRKGVYPYEYLDSFERFEEPMLPSIHHFYSTLTGSTVSESDYAHAQRVFESFQCRHLGDYHDLYLKSDVLLLADVFENFRGICLNYYKLDPANFYTSPGLAWTACLKMTGVELELVTDPDMYLFIEEGLRGGISMITHRYAKANNPYVRCYTPEQPHNYIMYLDMNNLYGTAMSEPLPVNNFSWLTPHEIEEVKRKLMTLQADGAEGYILEVDLEYPEEIHKQHNDYPLAPERLEVPRDWQSPYCHQLLEDLQMKYSPTQKLVPNLSDKAHYIIHYRNLQQYLALGMKLKKIHRVISFSQSPWLKAYIDFNTDKRKQARNDFEKDFFKLMNNSVFGKTLENLRKRVDVKLVNTKKQFKKLSAKPQFDYFRIFNEDLVAVNMKKSSLYLNRPIYVGFTILELSKTFMYNFHYNVIKAKYEDQATLLFTDTDSLCYSIETKDIYEDMNEDLELYDTSEYPRNHPLFSEKNKKVLGKMKDETPGVAIEEFVGLRPKMYSLLFHQGGREMEKKTAKGVAKAVTKRDIKHQHYKECLFMKKRTIANMKQIRSDKHQLYTVNMNKIGLSPYDDKRYILEDGVTTLAYGHTLIR